MDTQMALYIVIAVLLVVLIVVGMVALHFAQKASKHKQESRTNEQNFNNLTQQIATQEQEKKEVSRRRRVTAKMKQTVMERDDCTCQICGISKGFVDSLCQGLGDYLLLEIDHIESVANGGTGTDEDNLQVLCWRCNKKKGGKKTNEQVKELIDYGIQYLKKEDKSND